MVIHGKTLDVQTWVTELTKADEHRSHLNGPCYVHRSLASPSVCLRLLYRMLGEALRVCSAVTDTVERRSSGIGLASEVENLKDSDVGSSRHVLARMLE